MSARVGTPRSLLRTGLIPAAAAVGATGINYLLNLLLAARLDPATFGDAALVVNLVVVAGVAAATLQLATSTLIARRGRPDASAVVAALVRVAVLVGGVLALLIAAFSGPLAAALHVVSPVVFVVLAATLPVFLVQAVHRGALQGRQRSGRLALSYGVEAAVRLVSCLLLVQAGAGAVGVAAAVAVSMVASSCVARTPSERGSSSAGEAPSWAEIRSTAGNALLLLLAQVLLLNTDVLLAKAWFPPSVAGTYAVAALLGRGCSSSAGRSLSRCCPWWSPLQRAPRASAGRSGPSC
ncbi:oligosaccharide flippase family protein [Amnibacterium kyonggiense]